MTTIEKPLNLLFSLPHELITYIFQSFDSTYRIFHTDKFRKELIGTGWLNLHKTLIKQRIESYIFDMVDNLDCIVTNEYGYLGDFESLQDHLKKETFLNIQKTILKFIYFLSITTCTINFYQKVLLKRIASSYETLEGLMNL